jgi:ABC-type lipoprotein export system ATPase subunit
MTDDARRQGEPILRVRLFSTRDKGVWLPQSLTRKLRPRLQINSLDICSGRCYAVIGKSGAGKTIFNSFLMGWPSFKCGRGTNVGEIKWWSGENECSLKTRQVTHLFSRLLAWHRLGKKGALFYLPQILPDGRGYAMPTKVYFHQVVSALRRQINIAEFKGDDFDGLQGEDKKDFREDLEKSFDKSLDRLSGGERRRVELWARLRVMRDMPHDRQGLLILDEPTTGLDIVQERKYLKMLRNGLKENRNVAALVTTHAMHLLDRDLPPEDRIFDGVIVVWKKVFKSSRWKQHRSECDVSPAFSPDLIDSSMTWEDALGIFKPQGMPHWEGLLKELNPRMEEER